MSWVASSTTSVSKANVSQSQFSPSTIGSEEPGAGINAKALHSPGRDRAASRALAEYMISVRTLIATMSSASTPAPSAIACSSSRYFAPKALMGASNPAANSRTVDQSQPA